MGSGNSSRVCCGPTEMGPHSWRADHSRVLALCSLRHLRPRRGRGGGPTVIIFFSFLAFALGLLFSYGSAGVRRQTGTLLMVAAPAWAPALFPPPTTASRGVRPV